MKPIDISGQRFGSWTVVRRLPLTGKQKNLHWECRCACGTVRAVAQPVLFLER